MHIYEFEVKDPEDAKAEGGLDYIAETDKTASNTFRCDHISRKELMAALAPVIFHAAMLDRYKKAMFRQRSRLESGLPLLYSNDENSIADGTTGLVVAPEMADLFHGVIGLCTEAGEAAEILQKYLVEGVADLVNVQEETGDVLWYLSRLVKFSQSSFLTIMKQNIAKLRKRHGESGFNREADITRDLDAERKTLEREG